MILICATRLVALTITLHADVALLTPIAPGVAHQPVILARISAITDKLDGMVHDIVIATAQNSSAIELEFEAGCRNADGNWALGSRCSDKLSVVVRGELGIAIIECNWLDLGLGASSCA